MGSRGIYFGKVNESGESAANTEDPNPFISDAHASVAQPALAANF